MEFKHVGNGKMRRFATDYMQLGTLPKTQWQRGPNYAKVELFTQNIKKKSGAMSKCTSSMKGSYIFGINNICTKLNGAHI